MLPRIFKFAFRKNIQIAGYPIFICHEITHEEVQKANKEENADLEVAVPIAKIVELPEDEEIRVYQLQGGKMAKIVHMGPYEECGPTYDQLFSCISEKGKKLPALFVRSTLMILWKFRLKRY